MKFDIRAELFFLLGTLLFMGSLFYFSGVLNRMLKLIAKPRFLSFLPVLGGIFLLFAGFIHFYKILFVYPRLKVAGFELFDIIVSLFRLNLFENIFFLIAGFFAFVSSFIYLYWVSR
jgi:hypothetical protein